MSVAAKAPQDKSPAEVARWVAVEYHEVVGDVHWPTQNAVWSAALRYICHPEEFKFSGAWIEWPRERCLRPREIEEVEDEWDGPF